MDVTEKKRDAELPDSDVSAWVGLIGLAGLLAWTAFCRNYPELAELLELPGPRQRLTGPYAALFAMVVTGALMVGWSILVDKVHRRPSTGIDWDRIRPVSAVLEVSVTKLAGLWGTWAIIGFLYCVCRWYWSGQYLFAMEVIGFVAAPLFLLSVPYVIWLDRRLKEPRDHAWHFGAMLIGREEWDLGEVKKHWRAWAIKGFFGAFMISILPPGFSSVVNADIGLIAGDPVRLGTFLFELLFVVDVQIGTVGYLLTLRPLDAHIRSGNPLLGGWVSALICYPPFVWGMIAGPGIFADGGAGVISYTQHTADWAYWFGNHEALLWLWAGWLVFLTAVYAWATVAFGIRFSNLTYRGVLTNGPYRYTRHPAYLSKNLFWWFSTMPFLVTSGSMVDVIRNTFFLACVSAIYYWRARTEEAHLLGEDAKYREYHAWMSRNGLITSCLVRLGAAVRRPSRPAIQPAE